MVNLLETLYGVTALSLVIMIVALVRRRGRAARTWGVVAALGGALSGALYWYLTR